MATIAPFSNHLPVAVRFGDGIAPEEAAALVRAAGAGRALAVVDAGLEDVNPAVAAVLRALDRDGSKVARAEKPGGEPTDTMIDALAATLADSGASLLIAIGGGSVIDTAKAARLCAQQEVAFVDLPTVDGALQVPPAEVSLVAVPSTAGTGSEVSGGAVITDSRSGRKAGIAHPNLRAAHAIVDPVLTHTVPPAATAFTGIDALAQAIAGMVARARTPIGDAIALEAIRLGFAALPVAYADGTDAEARSRMACASLLAGLTMNISDCAAEHSLGQAIASLFPAPHGLTVGVVIAETLERERRYVPVQMERIADAMGLPEDGTDDGSRAVAGVEDLLRRLDFPVLRSVGAREDDLSALADLAMADYFMTQSPHPWRTEEAHDVLAAAFRLIVR